VHQRIVRRAVAQFLGSTAAGGCSTGCETAITASAGAGTRTAEALPFGHDIDAWYWRPWSKSHTCDTPRIDVASVVLPVTSHTNGKRA
jgi:hypothetical protein